MLGIAPELVYDDRFIVDSVTLKFQIADEYIENELNLFDDEPELTGIKRLNIFKFFECINVLLPIETKFDIENNILYTEVDEFGVYCIMDMEKWFVMLGIEPESSEKSPIEPASFDIFPASLSITPANEPVVVNKIEVGSEEKFNVVFVIDNRSIIDDEAFEYVKDEILAACEEILIYSENASIYFMLQTTNPATPPKFLKRNDSEIFTDIDEIETLLNIITKTMPLFPGFDEICYVSDAITHIYNELGSDEIQTFVFSMFSQRNVFYRESEAYTILPLLAPAKISVSVIADIDGKYSSGYVFDLIYRTGGILIEISDIVEAAEPNFAGFQAFSAAGFILRRGIDRGNGKKTRWI
jgi:hypothetical protein